MFKVVTNTGTLAYLPENGKGNPKGFSTEESAQADADARNHRASKLGINTRYEVASAA